MYIMIYLIILKNRMKQSENLNYSLMLSCKIALMH